MPIYSDTTEKYKIYVQIDFHIKSTYKIMLLTSGTSHLEVAEMS